MKIFKNDLTHYFLREHDQLPASYLKSCRKFFKELSYKQQATSDKLQASSFKRQAVKNNCTKSGPVLKTDSTERYKNENK